MLDWVRVFPKWLTRVPSGWVVVPLREVLWCPDAAMEPVVGFVRLKGALPQPGGSPRRKASSAFGRILLPRNGRVCQKCPAIVLTVLQSARRRAGLLNHSF